MITITDVTADGHTVQVGDRVTSASCGRADNVQYIREGVTGTVEKIMGIAVAFRDDDGALYFSKICDLTMAADGEAADAWHARLRGIAAAANRPARPVYGQAGRWT